MQWRQSKLRVATCNKHPDKLYNNRPSFEENS